MNVALFFDGKNFSKGFQRYNPNAEIDYGKLAKWLTSKVSDGKGELVGAYYYTGHNSQEKGETGAFTDFLKELELQTGYYVKRERRVTRRAWCSKCKSKYTYRAEKRVDTRLVADMIQLAAVNAYDAAVLLSGDQDFIPAVEAANALGKRVYVAAWPGPGVSLQLRTRCYAQIDLKDGLACFSSERSRTLHEPSISPTPSGDPQTNMIREIERALEIHEYLSPGHFINKWRPQLDIPEPGPDREAMLNTLIADGKVIEETRDEDGRRFKVLNIPPQ